MKFTVLLLTSKEFLHVSLRGLGSEGATLFSISNNNVVDIGLFF